MASHEEIKAAAEAMIHLSRNAYNQGNSLPSRMEEARTALEAAEAVRGHVPWDANGNRRYEPVERLARVIYESFAYDGPGTKPKWTPHGNGLKQDEARAEARKQLRQSGHSEAQQ